jgi:hypothetical protein
VSVPLSGLIEPGQGWRAYAECGPDTAELFHPADDEDDLAKEPLRDRRYRERAAVRLCGSCPVRMACLAYVESVEARTGVTDPGVWGGTTPQDRRQESRDRLTLTPLRGTATGSGSTPRYWASKAVRAVEQIDADSVRHLARRGVPPRQMAEWLRLSLDAVQGALQDHDTDGEVAA